MSRGVLRMSKLGRHGRFGNSVFQYMFLRQYAAEHDLTVQVPHWIGTDLYGFTDELPDKRKLPVIVEKAAHGRDDTIIPHLPQPLRNVDVEGYFQYHTSYYRAHRQQHRSMFYTPVPSIYHRLAPAMAKFRSLGTTRVGVHLRRGDYGQLAFYITPVDWYLAKLRKLWEILATPVLFIATETLTLVPEFAEFSPVCVEDLGIHLQDQPLAGYNYLSHDKKTRDPRAMDWFPDWYFLQQCHVILAPNSTFSVSAALTSSYCTTLHRSNPAHYDGCGGDLSKCWDTYMGMEMWDFLPAQFVAQPEYQHIPGLYLDSNPYWKH